MKLNSFLVAVSVCRAAKARCITTGAPHFLLSETSTEIGLAALGAIPRLDLTLYQSQPYRRTAQVQHDALIFHLQYVVFHKPNPPSEKRYPIFPLRHHAGKSTDIVLSLPNVEQLQAEDFNLDELVNTLTEALNDEPYRNEILSLTGDIAVLVIECLDKVSESRPDCCTLNPYHSVDHLL